MAFHYRKLLHQHHDHKTPYYSPAPSPSSSPPPPHHHYHHYSPLPHFIFPPFSPTLHVLHDDDGFHNHMHLLQAAMIVLSCTLGFVMILCTMSIIRRYYYYSRRHNHRRGGNTPILFHVNGYFPSSASDDDGHMVEHPIWFIRTEGLQQSVIDSITVFTYRKHEGLIDGTECCVCLGEFQEDETLRLLPKCSHGFHIPCIDTWLRSHKNCPLCRAPVAHDAISEADESQEMINTVQMENFDGGIIRNHNNFIAESEGSAVRISGDGDAGGSGVNCHSSILIGSLQVEEETQPMRRSISMDSSSMMFHDLNSDQESLDNQLGDSRGKDAVNVDKQQGSGSSATICKVASIGRVLLKRPISFRRSSFSSHNTNPLSSSRHCRSQSLTLPL